MLSRYLTGAALARTGDELSGPALLVLGLTGTGSPIAGSVLLAALTASAALGGPVFGALLDRTRRPGAVLTAALAAYAVGLVAILASAGRLPWALVVVLAALAGLVNPAVAGGWTSQLPHVLGGRELGRATAWDAATFNVASLAGPALAAVLADRLGASTAVAFAAGLIVLALPSAWSLPARATQPREARWTEGFAAIFRRRPLLRATVTSTVSYVGVGMTTVCYPLLGARSLGSPARGALLLAVLAVSALAANALLARWPWRGKPETLVLTSTLVLAVGALLGVAPGPLVFASAAVTGLGEGPQLTALFQIRHQNAPSHLRAQVFTTAASLKITGFAAGSALAGPLADWSPTGCLAVAAAAQLTAAAAHLALREVRRPSPARAA